MFTTIGYTLGLFSMLLRWFQLDMRERKSRYGWSKASDRLLTFVQLVLLIVVFLVIQLEWWYGSRS